jgi:sugar transferase (PEP-CTERM/EpsH1 system associated)
MTILYLSHRVPYPPNKGDKIRSYHHVRHLARRHRVRLVSFVDQPGDERGAAALREYCEHVELVPLSRVGALVRGAAALATGRSLTEGFLGTAAMRAAVARAAHDTAFDVAWAFSSGMAQYLPAVHARLRIADFADVDSEKWLQFAQHSRGPVRSAYALESRRLRAFECRMSTSVDQVLFVSPAEASLFRSFCPEGARVSVVPIGVDTTYFQPAEDVVTEDEPTLLFTGALDYRPNVDATLFCVRCILPLVRRAVPNARFVAVGHRPAARLQRETRTQDGTFRVAGSVPDVRPYFRQARVYVAPLQLGRGVQNKILEAMAMRVPVVASPLAVAGLDVQAGRHALVCETPEDYATAIVSLLRNAERCRQLTDAAYQLIQSRYSWDENLKLVDACLAGGSSTPAAEPQPAVAPAALGMRA